MAVIGLDVGTSGVKSTLFADDAKIIGHAYREYNLIGGEGEYELDPRELWDKTRQVLAESVRDYAGTVDAISVTSFGESFVCLDEDDQVLCNTMIYMDPRGQKECDEFRQDHDPVAVLGECGQFIDKMFGMYKLRWMSRNKPEVLKKTKRICFVADFMTYMLGAEHQCDYSLAARTAMFNVFTKEWMDENVAFSRLDPSALPKAVPGGSVVGEISPRVASELGLKGRAKLIVGGHDQVLAAMGSGAWAAGDIANGMGTVDCIQAILARENLDPAQMVKYNFPIVPYLDSGNFITYPFNMSGGCTVKWFRDTLARDYAGREDAYALLNEEAPAEPTGLMVLPYFAGAGTPSMDADTPAVIAGLRLGTSRGKLFRAFLEGESYEMMVNIECMQAMGIDAKRFITVGGGSKSPLWMQIRADIFNLPVQLPVNKEAGTLASAMLGLVGTGVFKSIPEAQKALIAYDKTFTPNAAAHEKYREYFLRYKKFYEVMRDFYKA